jgi:adenosylcobinamide-phosphate synthase
VRFRPELGLGDEADVEHLQSALGLAWRGLVLWVLVIGLITLAHWVG